MDLLAAVARTRGKIPDADAQQHDEPYTKHDRASHCRWMLDEVERAATGARESPIGAWPVGWNTQRCHRWLGWVQGVAYAQGWATIAELRAINKAESRGSEAVGS